MNKHSRPRIKPPWLIRDSRTKASAQTIFSMICWRRKPRPHQIDVITSQRAEKNELETSFICPPSRRSQRRTPLNPSRLLGKNILLDNMKRVSVPRPVHCLEIGFNLQIRCCRFVANRDLHRSDAYVYHCQQTTV